MSEFNFIQDISKEIFEQKYMGPDDESVNSVFKEVAKEIASVETKVGRDSLTELFYEQLVTTRFIPAGRILANARLKKNVHNYNNCFTIGIDDSIESIADSIKEYMLILKSGGGVGFNASKIRPEGTPISTGGITSGVMSFLEIFNTASAQISVAGNRRGASIVVLNIDHPEIERFITYKQGDENEVLKQFNISVGVTDKFMTALKNDQDWDLVFNDKVYKTVKAKDLYNLITKNAFKHNEPGLFNLDTVNKESNSRYLYYIQTVNPCFTGDTMVAVADGRNAVSIKELAETDKEFLVYSGKEKTQGNPKGCSKWKPQIKKAVAFKTGTKEVIKVKLSDSSTFKCTPDHKLALPSGNYVEAQNSTGLEIEKFYTYSSKNISTGYGHRHIKTKTNAFNKQYRMLWEFNNGKYDGKHNSIHHIDGNKVNDSFNNLKLISKSQHDVKEHSIACTLNPVFKIHSTLYFNLLQKRKSILANAKKWNLEKSKLQNALQEFDRKNNFIKVQNKYNLDKIIKTKALDKKVFVVSVTKCEEIENVYDLTVEDNHNFYIITKTNDDNYLNSSGVLVHNCGEQSLPEYGCCDLGALNLAKFVLHTFEKGAIIDWRKLRDSISASVRFLDNVLDATEYPLKKIKNVSLTERRIGLGFTAYGDMLSMLRLVYGSKEANDLTDKLAAFFRDVSYETSIELAKEKGSFSKFDFDGYSKSEFFKRLPKKIKNGIKKYGIRNIAINTVAPTGTTSFSLGQNCSSGIEPIFSLQYDRTIRFGKGDETKTETVYDNAWLQYLDYLKVNNFEFVGVPDYFITSGQIDPYDHVKVQSIWQNYIDASISKTINLPKDYTIEQYRDLYRYAYDMGLKGITSFNPMGCGSLDTKIRTELGQLSFEQIFNYQGYNTNDLYIQKQGWLPINTPLRVYDKNNRLQQIDKLFIKGVTNIIYKLEVEDGNTFYFTGEHKLMLTSGDWIYIKDLKEGDNISSVNINKKSKVKETS